MAEPKVNNFLNQFSEYRDSLFESEWLQDLDKKETKKYLQTLEESRFASLVYEKNQSKSPLIQPRGGVATFQNQFKLTKALYESGADFIPLTIDSLTRHNDYSRASALLELSEIENKSLLNGYPLVSHGYKITRQLYDKIDRPISLRHGTPDAKLLVEIAMASGITEIEGGGLCYSLPYSRDYPIDRAILNWQYIDRLCSEMSINNKLIHRESFGPLSATMVPPMIIVVVQVLELLLAVEQGVKSFAVSFGQTGSIDQDIAIANALRYISKNLLDKFGFEDIKLRLVYHQWMGAFPFDKTKAEAIIGSSSIIASLINADKIVTKTYQESIGVPTITANKDGIKLVKYIFNYFQKGQKVRSDRSLLEEELIISQSQKILDTIFNSKSDSLWESIYHAVINGIIDIPFTPHIDNCNKLITIRDKSNGIRILNPGKVPISKRDLDKEKKLISQNINVHKKLYEKLLDDINLMI